jgi:hypothetical protein
MKSLPVRVEDILDGNNLETMVKNEKMAKKPPLASV